VSLDVALCEWTTQLRRNAIRTHKRRLDGELERQNSDLADFVSPNMLGKGSGHRMFSHRKELKAWLKSLFLEAATAAQAPFTAEEDQGGGQGDQGEDQGQGEEEGFKQRDAHISMASGASMGRTHRRRRPRVTRLWAYTLMQPHQPPAPTPQDGRRRLVPNAAPSALPHPAKRRR
jgi:hypothetical protein